MSKHAKDWALTAAVPVLAATGLGAAGIGPLAGLLGAAGAAGGSAAGAGLLGEGSALGMPLMGSVSAPMAETAMLAPPQIPTAGGFLATMQSPQMGMAMKGMSLANSLGQSPQSQTAQAMPQQQPSHPTSLLYGMTPEELQKRGIFSAGAYLNG